MDDTTLTNPFNSDNTDVDNIKTQHRQIMTTITDRILILEPITKTPLVENYIFFAVSMIISFV